jgi:tripartite-type tricarboxylate transporter receptor subunit TctC
MIAQQEQVVLKMVNLLAFGCRHILTAICTFAASTWLLMPAPSMAQTYPSRPIKIVVPYSPGGSTDVIARVIGEHMSGTLKQPVIIENKVGASGKIGSLAVVNAPADGYTLLATNMGPGALVAAVETKAPYHPVTDFSPISLTATMPLMICVAADSPYQSVKDLLNDARSKPGQLNFATTGVGGTSHLANALMARTAGVKFQSIPYKGGPDVVQALLTQQAAYTISPPSDVAALIKGGKLRALAVLQKARSPLAPQVPGIVESGGPDIEIEYWNGMLAPANTPAPIIEALNRAIAMALESPSVRSRLESIVVPNHTTSAQFKAIISNDLAKWTKVAQDANIKVE